MKTQTNNITDYHVFSGSLMEIPSNEKQLITTINAHSYNTTFVDKAFENALKESDILIPDGISIVLAFKYLNGQKINKIAGADLFFYEMERLQKSGGKVFFMGSSDATLNKIKARAAREYPNVTIATYSPPYKPEFSEKENEAMITAINSFEPDVLFVGMTAPKQEKWAYQQFNQLKAGHVGCIGAVFDFYAGTVKRAPQWMIKLGLEWFYRLVKEPKRMWKRYIVGNSRFIYLIVKQKRVLGQ